MWALDWKKGAIWKSYLVNALHKPRKSTSKWYSISIQLPPQKTLIIGICKSFLFGVLERVFVFLVQGNHICTSAAGIPWCKKKRETIALLYIYIWYIDTLLKPSLGQQGITIVTHHRDTFKETRKQTILLYSCFPMCTLYTTLNSSIV